MTCRILSRSAWAGLRGRCRGQRRIIAGSLALTSFGFDSVIELISASLVLRRLQAERAGAPADEQAERLVLRGIAVTFFALACYVVVGSAISLSASPRPRSWAWSCLLPSAGGGPTRPRISDVARGVRAGAALRQCLWRRGSSAGRRRCRNHLCGLGAAPPRRRAGCSSPL